MERLRRINGGRPVTDKAAVVMLAQEIEAYRAHIEQLRGMNTKLLTEDIVKTVIFAKNVKRLLDEKCMSQRELADAAGVTEVAMSRYLNDGRMPKGPILYNIAKVLGVSVDDLLAGPEEKDCTSCEYGPVWNDVCRTCRGTGQTNADPEETAAGSGPQAETEAGNIRNQLIRKGDALEILNGIISVPRKTPDESIQAFQKHLQKYADRIKALPAEGTAEPKVNHCPFCGGHATVEETDGEISSAWVECDRCGARTRKHFGQDKADRAIKAWNRRPDTEE
jgi:Lar family restriction alleviation protein